MIYVSLLCQQCEINTMIKYSLKCSNNHYFESWFKSVSDYDRLEAANLLSCTICESSQIQKELMAPNVPAKNRAGHSPEFETAVKAAKESLKGAKNVGWQFANEARAIHYGDKEEKPIYGRTEPSEALDLIKEGINIAPLPFDPDAKDN